MAFELVPGIEVTAAVHTISTSFDTLMNPYYIGYIPFELFPKNWCINTHEITPDTITITQLKQNVPFGFCYQTADYSQLYYKDAGGTCRKYNNNSDCYFINKMCIADLTYVDYIRLEVMIITAPNDKIIDDGAFSFGTPNNTTYDFRRQDFSVIIDISTLNAFINNNGTITINGVIINGQSENITLSYSDFNNAIAYKSTSTHTIRAQIYNVAIGRSSKYKNGSISANIVPFIGIDCPAGSVPEQRYMALLFEWQSYYTLTYDNLGNFGSLSVGMDVSGYSIGRYQTDHLYRDEIVDLAGQLEYSTLLNMNGWYRHQYFEYSGGNSFRLYPAIDATDIRSIVSLINKIEIGATSAGSITATDTYYDTQSTALYTGSNATTENRAIENYVPDLLYQLQPWQQPNIDITANKFTNDDVPPYTPGTGEDGDGDNILPPALSGIGDLSGFVTMYALKADHLSYFGSQLWASFISDDFWKSVTTVFDNTTAIDPSVILDYIVSIRLYPFDLSQVSGATSDFAEIFFGRGLSGIFVSSDPITDKLYVLSKCATRVDGGVLRVPEKYGDFRDMEPCAKMVLHVPFAGSCEINPSQVVGKYLSLSYSIDYCTGAFMAQCFVSGDGLPMSYPVATLYGQLGATVQLSASNEMESLQCLAGATLGIASGSMGNIAGAIGTMAGVATSLSNNRTLPHTTGKSAGFSSFYEPRVPYIEILYDQYYVPDNYAHVHGCACNTTSKIGDLHGYTVCRNVDTTGLTCETDERLSIKRILESGFFVD